ncbi:MAG: phosphodiester glycosidase family protein [Myxococcales bacterium]|nr:phosphodiester glycosidase family protein [Myxococcales bacterium]
MRSVLGFVVCATALFAGTASAQVSDPHPGIRLVNHGSTALVVADLCAAGVSVRATKYGERNKTAAGWAQAVDAEVAINADFFDFPGWSFVVGRARGGGEDWPADKQLKEVRSYWQFGINQAGLVPNAATEPGYLVTDIVGGHNILIENGQGKGPVYDGDAVLEGAHRRTAVGISADQRYLYFFVSNTPLNGDGIVWSMVANANEAGAAPIHWATNMDGGGSSQLYVKGIGSVISSTRPVNNHLGIYAKGAGESWQCNRAPEGWLDSVDASGAVGWTRDVDVPDAPVSVHLSFGGPALSGAPAKTVKAEQHRDDLCTAIGSCAHGFKLAPPLSLMDGQPHEVHAYGMDEAGLKNAELAGSPKTFQATAPAPTGERRHVQDPTSYAAWKLDDAWHHLPTTDAAINDLPVGEDLPATPSLAREDGSPAIFVIDGAERRWVTGVDSLVAWSFELADVVVMPAAELSAIAQGLDWPARPVLVVKSDGAVYALDTPAPKLGEPPQSGSGGKGSSGKTPGKGSGGAGEGETTPSGDMTGGCAVRAASRSGGTSYGWGLALLGLGLLGCRGRQRRAR